MNDLDCLISADKEFKDKQQEAETMYASSNTIYHYTKLDTLLEHILPDKTLRLSSKRRTYDPYENQRIMLSEGGMLPLDNSKRAAFEVRIRKVKKLIESTIDKDVRIISFCMNSDEKPGLERFGYKKPRMWAQYGDRFKGACIAIDLAKLKMVNDLDADRYAYVRPVCYTTFENYPKEHLHYHSLEKFADDSEFVSHFINMNIDTIAFSKHEDYKYENEMRICQLSKQKYTYLNITDCISGVIVNSHEIKKHPAKFNRLFNFSQNIGFCLTETEWYGKDLQSWHSSMG